MESSAPLASPSSDERFWSKLRCRVDTILGDRRPRPPVSGDDLKLAKRFNEDSLLLIKGIDSVSSSLAHLNRSLSSTRQGMEDLTKPPAAKVLKRENQLIRGNESQNKAKRLRVSKEIITQTEENCHGCSGVLDDKNGSNPLLDDSERGNLRNAKELAISMATKASSLARALTSIKSELNFMQERCSLLEEENRRLRDGLGKGARPEEDDLVRLQLEALLTEKSRLANENANLARENECLLQLVEYHQLTTESLSTSYEQEMMERICFNISSPNNRLDDFATSIKDERPCTLPIEHQE